MAINYGRLGRMSTKWKTLLWSLLATTALISIIFIIPEDTPIRSSWLYVPQIAVMYSIAKSLQGPAIDAHRERGGALASVWRAVGIGVLCSLLILGTTFGVVYLTSPQDFGSVVEFNSNEVYYLGEATREDATFLGEFLTQIEFFDGSSGASVQMTVSSGVYTVSFVLVDDAWNDPDIINYFRSLGEVLADTRLGRPLTVNLCDSYLVSQKSLRVD